MAVSSVHVVTRWTTRVIPTLLFGAIVFAAYVVIARVCVAFFLHRRSDARTAIAFLVPFCILLCLLAASYLRLILVIVLDPGVLPLSAQGEAARANAKPAGRRRRRGRRDNDDDDDLEAGARGGGYDGGPDADADSPGLETFYTKDVFVCQDDGRPRWCGECKVWKADRAHHSREIGRCVRKMDHFCPWVGGMIGENSFKFFVQFLFYAASYCGVALGASAYTLKLQIEQLDLDGLDPMVIAVVGLAGFFGLFTFLMAVTSLRYILIAQTNVDVLRYSHTVHLLALRVPPHDRSPDAAYGLITYPLHKPGSGSGGSASDPGSERDRMAQRTFAIVKTELGENPWDLGPWGNWTQVMGTNPLDWLLPIRKSPCCDHEDPESYYRLGKLVPLLRARYRLPELPREKGGVEMRDLGRRR